jgi:hypothetical protein
MPVSNCEDELRKLYDAIMALQTGERAVQMGFGERQVTFHVTQLKDLRQTYALFYRDCGAESGLPDMSQPVQRGAPATARFC